MFCLCLWFYISSIFYACAHLSKKKMTHHPHSMKQEIVLSTSVHLSVSQTFRPRQALSITFLILIDHQAGVSLI